MEGKDSIQVFQESLHHHTDHHQHLQQNHRSSHHRNRRSSSEMDDGVGSKAVGIDLRSSSVAPNRIETHAPTPLYLSVEELFWYRLNHISFCKGFDEFYSR